MQLHHATLLEIKELGPGLFMLRLIVPECCEVEPGQFFEFLTDVRFLPRALSVADKEKNILTFVLRVVGEGTSWLSRLNEGAKISIRGPLGHGVSLPGEGPVMLLAGGVGAAPLHYLARKLKERGLPAFALLAASTESELILVDEFRLLCEEVFFATDDGSLGKKGFLTDVLSLLPKVGEARLLFACGPEAMFSALKRLKLSQPVYAFLESRMGCGTGLCVGCAVLGNDDKYHRVCLEGPVFNLEDIKL
jgi:dihydroorotate dehydrogenase electron transfer subunit